jgi:uncharacterized protein YbaP (TraB family)
MRRSRAARGAGLLRKGLTALMLCGAAAGAWAQPACTPAPPAPGPEQWRTLQREARDHGLLWRLQKDGRESWLFGTLHVGRPAWSVPGPHLREALARSDLLALEIDPADPELAARLHRATRGALPPQAGLRRRLQAQAVAACLPADALQALPALLQALTLTLLAARQDGLDASYAQELMLAAAARSRGLRVVALENVEQQAAALLPDDPVLAAQLLDDALDQLERGRASPVLRRLSEAWSAGDLETLSQYAQWCECADSPAQRAWLQRINDGRNMALAEGIDALHGQGLRVLAAVGALHMTGPQALPELLAKRGFKVQRVAF